MGVLVKSVAVLFVILIVEIYLVFSGDLVAVLRLGGPALLLACLMETEIPAMYLVPNVLLEGSAFKIMFEREILQRATHGFHHQDDPSFYLKTFFHSRPAAIQETLVFAVVWAIARQFRGAHAP